MATSLAIAQLHRSSEYHCYMDDIQKLQALIDDKFDGNQAAFARAVERQPAQISQYLKGRRTIGTAFKVTVERQLGIPGYFLVRKQMLPQPENLPDDPDDMLDNMRLSIIDQLESEQRQFEEQTTRIPEYGTGGRMGPTGVLLRDQPGEIRGWDVTREWLRKNVPNCTSPANLAIVTGFGDSMRPLYNPGDPLLVDIGVTKVAFDAIYFFRVGEEGFIKRLQRIPGNGLLAISENSSYRDWTITPEMDFEVFGRVIKVWKGDDF